MSLLNEIKNIQKEINQIKQNLSNDKFQAPPNSANQNTIFAAMEIRKKSDNSLIQVDRNNDYVNSLIAKNQNKKEKRKVFRVTYLRTAIPFLDLKNILNLSLLSKEFHYFINSVYIYKFVDQVKNFRTNKKILTNNLKNLKSSNYTSISNTLVDNKYSASKMVGSLVGAITGAFSVIGIGASNKLDNKNIINDPKILEEKLILHEKILKKKLENYKINTELKELREKINEIIENRKKKIELNNSFKTSDNIDFIENAKNLAYLSFEEKKSIPMRLKSMIINDEEFEKIKREKLEKEYHYILEEINQLKEEVIFFHINI